MSLNTHVKKLSVHNFLCMSAQASIAIRTSQQQSFTTKCFQRNCIYCYALHQVALLTHMILRGILGLGSAFFKDYLIISFPKRNNLYKCLTQTN